MDYNGVQNSELLGLVTSTLEQLPPPEIVATFKKTHYEVINRLFTADKITEPLEGGTTSWAHELILDDMGTAAFVNPYGKTEVVARDVLTKMTGPWSRSQFYWVISRDEVLMNAGRGKLVSLETSREAAAAASYADLREDAFFGTWNGAANPVRPYTLGYWLPGFASGQAGEGFYGGHVDTVGTAVGGVLPSGQNTTTLLTTTGVKDRWNSYQAGGTAYYTAVDDVLMTTMERAWLSIRFKKPVIVQGVVDTYSDNYRIYVNKTTWVQLAELAVSYEGIGPFNLRKTATGDLTFNGAPIVYIPALNGDTTDPIIFLNLNMWRVPVLNGMNMFRHEPMVVGSEQHNVFVTFVDKADNIICIDRRSQARINKTA